MAWALLFDGINDYVNLSKPFTALATDDWSLTLKLHPNGTHTNSYYRLISKAKGNNNARIIIKDNLTEVRYNSEGFSELVIPVPAFNLTDKIEFKNSADGFQLFIADVLQYTNATRHPCSLGVIGENFNQYSEFGLELADFQNLTTPTDSVRLDATASNHGAGTPVLTDTVAGNNATTLAGVMPEDGSAWLDLGGDPALEIDVPLITSSTSQVFTPDSVLSEKLIETPLVTSSTVQVETPTVTQGTPDIEVPLITSSNSNVYSPELLRAQVIDMGLVEGVGEVFSVEIAQPITLEVNARIDAPSVVYTVYVSLDGQGIFVPVENRVSWSKLSNFLRSQGFKGNNNDVITEWLYSEGAVGEEYNDMFLSYLKGQGYSGDSLNDLRKEWSKG